MPRNFYWEGFGRAARERKKRWGAKHEAGGKNTVPQAERPKESGGETPKPEVTKPAPSTETTVINPSAGDDFNTKEGSGFGPWIKERARSVGEGAGELWNKTSNWIEKTSSDLDRATWNGMKWVGGKLVEGAKAFSKTSFFKWGSRLALGALALTVGSELLPHVLEPALHVGGQFFSDIGPFVHNGIFSVIRFFADGPTGWPTFFNIEASVWTKLLMIPALGSLPWTRPWEWPGKGIRALKKRGEKKKVERKKREEEQKKKKETKK